jgi:hypothetical protein
VIAYQCSRPWQYHQKTEKYFEEMGELYVRRAMQMTDRFPFPFENSAREWLAERNEAQRPMREARQAKMAKQSEGRLGQHGLQC